MQFHGTADRYVTNGASTLATLFSNSSTSTPNPAVTVRNVGSNGGQAAAFTFDLARSIVYTRQGNPAWAGQERDGTTPIRSDDLFFGGSQPDWVDLSKVAIPQADEHQRLLANLIGHVNADRKPLPRFWYFPRGEKAVVVMTGDDHGNGGTAGRFNDYKAASPAGCSVAAVGVHPRDLVHLSEHAAHRTPRRPRYVAEGFEIGVHVNTGCGDCTPASLENDYADQLGRVRQRSSRASRRRRPTAPTASPGATGPRSRRSSSSTASGSTPTTTTGRRAGCTTCRACSPAPACRCASPTSTAR